jgi:hypothetical protein
MEVDDATNAACTWIQLFYQGENAGIGTVVKITPLPEDINDLTKTVGDIFSDKLSGVSYPELTVYAPQPPIYNADVTVPSGEVLKANAVVPIATYDNPLIVIAPNRQQQQNGELRCCFSILVFNVLFEDGNQCFIEIKFISNRSFLYINRRRFAIDKASFQ